MKLEIKHLAPYLPYGLKMNYEIHNPELIAIYGDYTIYLKYNDGRIKDQDISNYKPILYPLEYLTKEIEVNGEKFVPIERLFEIKYPEHVSRGREYYIEIVPNWVLCSGNWTAASLKISLSNIYSNYYWLIQKLAEWHIDFQGLIPAGLAIDINTLKD